MQASAFASEKVKNFDGENKTTTLEAARPSAISAAEANEPEIELLTQLEKHVAKWRNGSTDLFDQTMREMLEDFYTRSSAAIRTAAQEAQSLETVEILSNIDPDGLHWILCILLPIIEMEEPD